MQGVHLSDEGVAQAERLAERFATLPLAAVYSSPLERCTETAERVAHRHGLTVEVTDGLNELDYGEWTGKTFAELDADPRWKPYNQFRSGSRVPGGETTIEAQTRVIDCLLRLADANPDAHIAAVSHSDLIKAALAHFLGVPLDLFQRLIVHPASVSVLDLHPWGPEVRCINHTGDLPPD